VSTELIQTTARHWLRGDATYFKPER